MQEIMKLHNINKGELEVHLDKLLTLHDYGLEVIRKYIKEFKTSPEFNKRVEELKEFEKEVIKGKEHFVAWGVEGIAKDIESFPYECVQDTLPLTVSIGGDTRFWDLYDKVQDIAFEEIYQKVSPTGKTIWAGDIKKSIDAIRHYYYYDVLKSQLGKELLEWLRGCVTHYVELWNIAIKKIESAIKACDGAEDKKMIPSLEHAKRNLELRKRVPEEGGINKLIESLRESPISDPRRGTLDIYKGMYDVVGYCYNEKGEDLGKEIMDAVRAICAYYRSGFGFKDHPQFSYDRLRAKSEELSVQEKENPITQEESLKCVIEEYLARSKNWWV